MFAPMTIDGALRARMCAPLSVDELAAARAAGISEDDALAERVVDVAAQVPLTPDEITSCRLLEEPVSEFLAERNRLFAEAWRSKPAVIFDSAAAITTAGKAVAELTGRRHAAEIVLEVIGWRMSAERLSKIERLLESLRSEEK
jgi:hypothetical protein